MTLVKDLIGIPERVQKGDFVLRLAEGVQRPDETLRDYVVTPELTAHFEDALSFIRSAIQTRTSKATDEGRSATGWGDLDAGWDAVRFDEAIEALPYSESRLQLVSALISKFFASYDVQASGRGEAFVSLDHGLSVVSKHAANLGYEAVILS